VSKFSKKKFSKNGIETYFLSDKRTKDALEVAQKENQISVTKMQKYTKNIFLNMIDREKMIASNFLAIDIQAGMLGKVQKKYKTKDGGVREGPFWVLVGALMPSVLIEVGYLTNPKECKNLINLNYQKRLIQGIADGVDRYFIRNPL
jgi:N-acetylmuramoyl-L-alanine amidase